MARTPVPHVTPEPGTPPGAPAQAMEPTAITHQRITDDLDRLLEVLPAAVRQALQAPAAREQLLEVVLDLGRVPEARYPGRAVALGEAVVERSDLATHLAVVAAGKVAHREAARRREPWPVPGRDRETESLPPVRNQSQPAWTAAHRSLPFR